MYTPDITPSKQIRGFSNLSYTLINYLLLITIYTLRTIELTIAWRWRHTDSETDPTPNKKEGERKTTES